MTEEGVTDRVCDWLDRDWHIVARHFPGSHGGLYFHTSGRGQSGSRGSIIPDIVARRDDFVLFSEAKVRYTIADVRKMLRLLSPAYRASIHERLGLDGHETLLGSVAFHTTGLSRIRLGRGMVAFRVDAGGAVTLGGALDEVRARSIWGDSFGSLEVAVETLDSEGGGPV